MRKFLLLFAFAFLVSAVSAVNYDALCQFRQQINVTNTNSTISLPFGYSVPFIFDMKALVDANKVNADGSDMHIVFMTGPTDGNSIDWVDGDWRTRNQTSWKGFISDGRNGLNQNRTKIWFALQELISASAISSKYRLYYKCLLASLPSHNVSRVFSFNNISYFANVSDGALITGDYDSERGFFYASNFSNSVHSFNLSTVAKLISPTEITSANPANRNSLGIFVNPKNSSQLYVIFEEAGRGRSYNVQLASFGQIGQSATDGNNFWAGCDLDYEQDRTFCGNQGGTVRLIHNFTNVTGPTKYAYGAGTGSKNLRVDSNWPNGQVYLLGLSSGTLNIWNLSEGATDTSSIVSASLVGVSASSGSTGHFVIDENAHLLYTANVTNTAGGGRFALSIYNYSSLSTAVHVKSSLQQTITRFPTGTGGSGYNATSVMLHPSGFAIVLTTSGDLYFFNSTSLELLGTFQTNKTSFFSAVSNDLYSRPTLGKDLLTFVLHTDGFDVLSPINGPANSTTYVSGSEENTGLEFNAPLFFNINQSSREIGAETTLSVFWTDDTALSCGILEYNNGAGFSNQSFCHIVTATNWTNFSRVLPTTVGQLIQWRVYQNDSSGNMNVTSLQAFNTQDTISPKWSRNQTSTIIAGRFTTFSVFWEDLGNLNAWILSFDNGTGVFINDTSEYHAASTSNNWTNVTKFVNLTPGSNIKWQVYANDTSGNNNVTAIFGYISVDGDKPRWLNPIPAYGSFVSANASVILSVHWVDNGQLQSFIVEHNVTSGGPLVNVTKSFSGSLNDSNLTIFVSQSGGNYTWRIYANDSAGNMNVTNQFVLNVLLTPSFYRNIRLGEGLGETTGAILIGSMQIVAKTFDELLSPQNEWTKVLAIILIIVPLLAIGGTVLFKGGIPGLK